MDGTWTAIAATAALGSVSGMRSFTGVALLSRRLSLGGTPHSGTLARILAAKRVSMILATLAAGEMAADKSSEVPSRTEKGPLVGRAVLGALAGMAVAEVANRRRSVNALVGATAAVASAFALYHARKAATEKLHFPDWTVALAEDALAITIGNRAARVATDRLIEV